MNTPTRAAVEARMERYPDRQTWLERRRLGIGCSELPTLFGVNPYQTPFGLWSSKQPDAPPDEVGDVESRQWGLDKETAILKYYARRYPGSHLVQYSHCVLPHPRIDWLFGSLDAVLYEHEGPDAHVLQPADAKMDHGDYEYGAELSDVIPPRMVYQGCGLLSLLDAPRCDFVVERFGRPPREYQVPRDEELLALIFEQGSVWRERHLVHGERPEFDGSPQADAWIKHKHPQHADGKLLSITPQAIALLLDIQRCKEAIVSLEGDQGAAAQKLKDLIGEAEGIEGLCTWKKDRDSVGTDWKRVVDDLISGGLSGKLVAGYGYDPMLAEEVERDARAIVADLRGEYTGVTRVGPRKLLPKIKSPQALEELLESLTGKAVSA